MLPYCARTLSSPSATAFWRRHGAIAGAAAAAATATTSIILCRLAHEPSKTQLEETDDKLGEDKSEKSGSVFDFRSLQRTENDVRDFWNQMVSHSNPRESIKDMWNNLRGKANDTTEISPKADSRGTLSSMSANIFNILQGSGSSDSTKKRKSVADLVTKARESSEEGDVEDSRSFNEIIEMLSFYRDSLATVADKYIGNVDFSQLSATALFYYLEYEDERKNASWNRRVHRFCSGIDIDKLYTLNDECVLAQLCYENTVEQIKHGLEHHRTPYELVYAKIDSRPGQPANFVAIKRNQKFWSNSLEVLIGVRGTKSVSDAVTDLLCDVEDYQGGKVHGFILTSGKYIAQKHLPLLEELMKESGKSRINLTLIGHSLGAGAATIAAMELNKHKNITCRVAGFGCPALLSKELAKKVDFVTTVINNVDVVPRLSGVSAANLLLDVVEFDYYKYAERDIEYSAAELQKRQPLIFSKRVMDNIRSVVEPMIKESVQSTVKTERTKRVEPELFPPGKCIHFYHDGMGLSGSVVPNDFFSEIHVNRRMLRDHSFQHGYQQVFLELMRQVKGDQHFRFDEGKDDH